MSRSSDSSLDPQLPKPPSTQDEHRLLASASHVNRPKYHKQAVFLLLVYIPLITVPWELTCVLAQRPLNVPRFYDQLGLSKETIANYNGWIATVNVLNSIAGVLTIPVISALIAQAAAVHAQRHKNSRPLRSQQLAAMADRGWTNPILLGRSWKWRQPGSNGVRNLLYLATMVIILGAIQQPLYQALVPMETTLVATCKDTEYMRLQVFNDTKKAACSYGRGEILGPRVLGWDIEPTAINEIPHNAYVQKLTADLSIVALKDVKPHLWNNATNPEADKQTISQIYSESFVAGLEQGTTTGVLREHIMRLNSSVQCGRIERSDFPSSCGGDLPFSKTYSHGERFTRVCVPGQFADSPWTLSRDRQDILEDFFLDVLEDPGDDTSKFETNNYTIHCTARTTRGYFELGNYRNNYTWGPLLQDWPSRDEMTTKYNDILDYNAVVGVREDRIPSTFDNLTSSTRDSVDVHDMYSDTWHVSGPLTMAAISLFGNKTLFESAMLAWDDTINTEDTNILPLQNICSGAAFSKLDPEELYDSEFPGCEQFSEQTFTFSTLKEYTRLWLQGFDDTDSATTAMTAAVYLANEATLTMSHWNSEYMPSIYGPYFRHPGRIIYSGSGTHLQKPKLSVVAAVTISALLSLQLLGIVALTWLIYRGPSETTSLDAVTVSKMLADLGEEEEEDGDCEMVEGCLRGARDDIQPVERNDRIVSATES